jgi:hypothetical protein
MTFEFNLKGNRRCVIAAMTAVGFAVALMIPMTASAQNTKQTPDIVGTWILAAADKLLPDGTRVEDYGPNPHGLCIFTADGHYSLQVYRTDRLKFASGDKFSATPEEYKDAILGMSVGFGRYEVDPFKHTITFHRDGNFIANQEGSTGVDPYELKGDTLSWKVAARKDGSIPITVLRRAKSQTQK